MADNVKSGNGISVTSNKVIRYFKDIKSEWNKMTWPTRENVKKAVIAVSVFCLIYIIMISAFDYCWKNLYNIIFKA